MPAASSANSRSRLFNAAAILLAALILGFSWIEHWSPGVLILSAVSALALLAMFRGFSAAETSARQSSLDAQLARQQLEDLSAAQASRRDDLTLLGRYGNLLIGCTDLAETLQVSEQMLSQLLPESAGTIYPLIDGEGLAEATHLWGNHVVETRLQASSDECLCMLRKRVHASFGDAEPEKPSPCPHMIPPEQELDFASACIPLLAQGQSLGWMYLSAPGSGRLPKLQVAIAAADQLALALANLKLRQSLRDLSVRDPLTSLFNRRYLSESLGREMARSKRRGLPLSVLAFDLDHFKNFNDSYGHAAGDAVLVAFARLLQMNSRSEDIACRQGGEEFVLIMPEMDAPVAERRAALLMQSMAQMDVIHDGQLLPKLTTSIGLAVFPQNGIAPEVLLAQADHALYAAKALGRNRVEQAAALA